ncbi:MAG: aspartyl protease family protein [Candidatus Eisenbacteria bacterium]
MTSPYPPETGGGGSGSGIRDAKAQALIDRHVAWLGGWSTLRLQSLRLEGAWIRCPAQGTIVDRERRDGYRRTDFDLKVVQGTETVTPDDAWGINVSGQIEDLASDQAIPTSALDRSKLFLAAPARCRGLALPAQEKEGRSWEVVRFEYPNGDLSDLFLDRDGSTIWQREVTDTDTVWNKLSDWRVVDGLRFPFVQESFHEHAAANQTVRWETVTVNPPLQAGEFARPIAGQQIATIDDPSGSTPWMPIELHQGRYVFLQGTVNGEPTDIVLDSGAGITVLDRPTVERLHLETADLCRRSGRSRDAPRRARPGLLDRHRPGPPGRSHGSNIGPRRRQSPGRTRSLGHPRQGGLSQSHRRDRLSRIEDPLPRSGEVSVTRTGLRCL